MAKKKAAARRRKVRRASTVSASKLAAVVERAAKRASAANEVRLEKDSIVRPGILVGRVVRDKITLDAAQKLAGDISAGIAKSSKAVGLSEINSAVMIVDKRILVGFISPRQFDLDINR